MGALGALLVLAWWWRGPSPEAEAAAYFDRFSPKRAVVWDCRRGGRSAPETDRYWCLVSATEPVGPALPGAAHVGIGLGAYCFSVPRAARPPWSRSDADAYPVARVGRYLGCG